MKQQFSTPTRDDRQRHPTALHSSEIIHRYMTSNSIRDNTPRQRLEQVVSKAVSEHEITPNPINTDNVVRHYEKRLLGMEEGYSRSKHNYEASLKKMYQEKIVLLNIIGHDQRMIDEFRNKVSSAGSETFEEVQKKYQMVASGLYHQHLCPSCILGISKKRIGSIKSEEYEEKIPSLEKIMIRNPQSGKKVMHKKERQMKSFKLYSWMWKPNGPNIEQKHNEQINKLQEKLQQERGNHSKFIESKSKQIEQLRAQIKQKPTVVYRPAPAEPVKENLGQQVRRNDQRLRLYEMTLNEVESKSAKQEEVIRWLNDNLMEKEAVRLNEKYRRYYL